MPGGRPKKKGPKRAASVTLRGRTLEAMEALAEAMGDDPSAAIRKGLDHWLTTEEASAVFKSYNLDLAALTGSTPRRIAPVVPLERRGSKARADARADASIKTDTSHKLE